MDIEKLLPEIQKDILMQNHTTFRIGGKAKYFFVAKNKDDLIKAVKAAKELNLPFFVLGGGSNVLVSDKGFDGLIIKAQSLNYEIKENLVFAEAGVPFALLVRETSKRGLQGLEWAGGLPGTIGGAVRGNAGAFGGETKDNVFLVEALDENFKIKKLSQQECEFGYRSSIFKKKPWIILSVTMKLKEGDREKIEETVRFNISERRKRGPLEYPSVGSSFKNCSLKEIPKQTLEEFKDVIKTDPFFVIPTAAVIDRAGLKGFRVGNIQVSEKHPNFIINLGGGTAQEVKEIVKIIKEKVKNKFGLCLEEEFQCIGFKK